MANGASKHADNGLTVLTSASGGEAVTPHNTNYLTWTTRALWVGGAGNLAVEMEEGMTLPFVGVPAGTFLPLQVKRVLSTGTTATNILAIW